MSTQAPTGYVYRNGARPDLNYLARFLATAYSMRTIGTLPCGSIIVADATYPSGGDWWTICDNGGELNVEKINDNASLRSVPYLQWGGPSPIGRVVEFCALVMQGKPIESWGPSAMDDATLADLT